MSNALPYNFQWSTTHPHIAWADIYGNGVLVEVAVLALDPKNGDLHFIPIAALDAVDRQRLLKIIGKRDAVKYPLWDLLDTSTLKNGMNALEYFFQLAKVRTISGQIFRPNTGRVGVAPVGPMSARPSATNMPLPAQTQPSVAEQTQNAASEQSRRGPGRPPSSKK